ncbi:MAG: BBP7 family outer membrane beta-barrel protein [Planctomycetes bacterium]|nr:BBP7 family outer membrane beta-barrel protein [Planctomycetota bacterium]
MKRSQLTMLPTVVVTLVGLLATSNLTQAESPGYQSPSFYGADQARGGQGRPAPPFPASPLAGGFPAAQGDAFMDAHGRPIVMPASFNQSCPSGPGGGYCPTGDPMAVDFGGYSTPDQSGPHYFDFSADVVYLQAADVFTNVPAFTSVGIGLGPGIPTNPQLNPSGEGENYKPGFQVAARYDLGPLSVLEATYMGLYDFGFTQAVRSVDVAPLNQDNQLFSVFSQFGFLPLISEFDSASVHQISYESDLQSTEFSYRRYWVGANPRVSGTYLAGFRYVRMTENFAFSSITNLGGGNGNLTYATENDLLGFQLGGDGSICLRQGLRLNTEGKAGIYNNRYKFDSTSNVTSVAPNLQPATDGNQIAFVGEAGVSMVADIWPSVSIRGGYRVLYINSLVNVGDNVVTTAFTNPATPSPALETQGDALYHGFHGGIEYVW